jgi:putative membrane protein
VAANLYAWEFRRFALGEAQIFSTSGLLSPTSQIAIRLKLHSVEIAQGPLARRRGYATVHLGLAGGTFAIAGVPIEAARDLRARVLETIAATDYSRLDQALNEAQSGLSANFLAT